MIQLDPGPRARNTSSTPDPWRNAQWVPTACVALAITAIAVRFSGVGLELAYGAAVIAVATTIKLWRQVRPSQRLLLVGPSLITLVLLAVYLAIPHGAHVADSFGSSATGQSYSGTSGQNGAAPAAPAAPQSSAPAAPQVTTPTADMPLRQRLALWSKLIPPGQISTAEPSVNWDNNAVLTWVNDWINNSQNPAATDLPYDGQYQGAYWLSYAAVADSHGPLAARPATDGTSASFAYIDPNSGTVMTGSPGDPVRVLHGAVVQISDGTSATLTITFTFTTEDGRSFWVASVS